MEDTFNSALIASIAGAVLVIWVVHQIKKALNFLFSIMFLGLLFFCALLYNDTGGLRQDALIFLKSQTTALAAANSDDAPPVEQTLNAIRPFIHNVKMEKGKVVFKGIESDLTGEIALRDYTTIKLVLHSKMDQNSVNLAKKIVVAFSNEAVWGHCMEGILKSPQQITLPLPNGSVHIDGQAMTIILEKSLTNL
jgi:hypothetical protein